MSSQGHNCKILLSLRGHLAFTSTVTPLPLLRHTPQTHNPPTEVRSHPPFMLSIFFLWKVMLSEKRKKGKNGTNCLRFFVKGEDKVRIFAVLHDTNVAALGWCGRECLECPLTPKICYTHTHTHNLDWEHLLDYWTDTVFITLQKSTEYHFQDTHTPPHTHTGTLAVPCVHTVWKPLNRPTVRVQFY